MAWISVCVGLVMLLLAGDSLVKGAVNLSLRLGIPALIVSLTIVAFGTSAPELLIAIKAVLDGASGIAIGNVVGSNTANVLLVLGGPAILATLNTSECDTRKSYVFMIIATLVFIGIAMTGTFTWVKGAILLGFLAVMLGDQMLEALRHSKSGGVDIEEDLEGIDPDMPWWKIIVFLVLGLIGLPLGADLLVDGSSTIARSFGVSEAVIGLTLVALGTSLPELATTVMAALRNQADVALGSVIGSNMFNLLAIIGIASLVGDIDVAQSILGFDIWIMLGASVLLGVFVFTKINITKLWGIGFTALYAGYIAVVLF